MMESMAYVKDGNVPEKKQVFIVAHYLTGKGRTFYSEEVAIDPYSWRIREFFKQLFNFCFPVNYRNQQHNKITTFMQNNLTVREYLHELNEMWNTIGERNDQLKVDKFWKGLRWDYQRDLWKDKLNPEVSMLKEVVTAAEVIEILRSVMTGPRENKPGRRHDGIMVRSAATTPEGMKDTHPKGFRRHQRGQRGRTHNKPGSSFPKSHTPRTATNNTCANYPKRHRTSRPKLSKDEEARCKAEGLCFVCSVTGHFSRNCPQRNKVASSSGGNLPPGVTSYGVDIDFGDIKCQRGLSKASTSSVQANLIESYESGSQGDDIDSLPELMSDEYSLTKDESSLATPANTSGGDTSSEDAESEASEWYPYKYPFCRLPTDFGEPLSERPRGRLAATCYPGEDPDNPEVYTWDRFWVYRIKNGFHVVMDDLYPSEDGFLVASRWLRNPKFHIDKWYWRCVGQMRQIPDEEIRHLERQRVGFNLPMGRPVEDRILGRLIRSYSPHASIDEDTRFTCICREEIAAYEILDTVSPTHVLLPIYKTENPRFDVARWYRRRVGRFWTQIFEHPDDVDIGESLYRLFNVADGSRQGTADVVELYHTRVVQSRFSTIQRNVAMTRDFKQTIPKPIVVVAHVNGQPARALIDTGSLADFISLTLVEQLKLERVMLEKLLTIQLAVQGSRSKVNFGVKVCFQYQGMDYTRYFDVINLQNYDMILGTPFLYQHCVMVGLNSPRVVLGSKEPLEMRGTQVSVLESRAMEVYEDSLEQVHRHLRQLAQPLCLQAGATALPPLCALNHSIPLIDEDKIYPWRPLKCPEVLRSLWIAKKNSYLKSGCWELTTARNTCPMLLITKPGIPTRLRVVVDLHEHNKNTRKLSSPMPDMEGILWRVARKPYRSIIDGQDAYEQICVIPEHVEWTAVTTPDGNMVSHVIQQGDCNAPATYQALMNHMFGEHIGVFMDVYLDDIIIYSDTLEEHVWHVTTVIRILKKEKLYLSEKKLHFLCKEVKILGCVVTDDGIRMDPEKVDRVVNWKVPTNRTLCRGFVGVVGYLADDIFKVRVPLGVLAEASAKLKPFQWGYTEQHAFETVKRYVLACAPHCHVPLDYSPDRDPIWVMTDACGNGIGGVVAQGHDWKGARVAAFYSAKCHLHSTTTRYMSRN